MFGIVLNTPLIVFEHFASREEFKVAPEFQISILLTFIWKGLVYLSNEKTRTISNIVTPRRATLQNLTSHCFNLCAEFFFSFTSVNFSLFWGQCDVLISNRFSKYLSAQIFRSRYKTMKNEFYRQKKNEMKHLKWYDCPLLINLPFFTNLIMILPVCR